VSVDCAMDNECWTRDSADRSSVIGDSVRPDVSRALVARVGILVALVGMVDETTGDMLEDPAAPMGKLVEVIRLVTSATTCVARLSTKPGGKDTLESSDGLVVIVGMELDVGCLALFLVGWLVSAADTARFDGVRDRSDRLEDIVI